MFKKLIAKTFVDTTMSNVVIVVTQFEKETKRFIVLYCYIGTDPK